MSTVAFHFCKYNERAYLNREAHEDRIGNFCDFTLRMRARRAAIVEVFAACANSLIAVAREDKDFFAPGR